MAGPREQKLAEGGGCTQAERGLRREGVGRLQKRAGPGLAVASSR